MLRKFISMAAIALLLVTTISATGQASGHVPEQFVLVSGSLDYVPDLPIPHFEVSGYVLLGISAEMTTLVGNNVTVIGTEVTGPSIYMRRALQVTSLLPSPTSVSTPRDTDETSPLPAPIPSEPAGQDNGSNLNPPAMAVPATDEADERVTTPVIAGPTQEASEPGPTVSIPVVETPGQQANEGDSKVTIPVIAEPIPVTTDPDVSLLTPAPLYGTLSSVLFGRVEAIQAEYYIVDPVDGHLRYKVQSDVVDLAAFAGQLVGAVATANETPGGIVSYSVAGTISLSRDLADLVQSGHGLIFQLPTQEIEIRLHGQTVHWNPAPIIGNSRTLVGLRSVSEALGATVTWNNSAKTATVALGDREVSVTLGSSQVIVHRKGQGDKVIHNDTASIIADGRMMVPLRVISEGLGVSVSWDDTTHTIDLN